MVNGLSKSEFNIFCENMYRYQLDITKKIPGFFHNADDNDTANMTITQCFF